MKVKGTSPTILQERKKEKDLSHRNYDNWEPEVSPFEEAENLDPATALFAIILFVVIVFICILFL